MDIEGDRATMNCNEKSTIVKSMYGDNSISNELVMPYLSLAKSKILNVLYPFKDNETEIPEKYDYLQCELAVWLLAKRGGEAEESHSENGISRKYLSEQEILSQITPLGKVGGI